MLPRVFFSKSGGQGGHLAIVPNVASDSWCCLLPPNTTRTHPYTRNTIHNTLLPCSEGFRRSNTFLGAGEGGKASRGHSQGHGPRSTMAVGTGAWPSICTLDTRTVPWVCGVSHFVRCGAPRRPRTSPNHPHLPPWAQVADFRSSNE